jgi:hypothetical protein
MNPDEIQLDSINKMFEFERQSRIIDELSPNELKNFAKLYCKLYLKQQEVIGSLNFSGTLEI